MGTLANKAKLRSKWLKLDINESVVVQYLDWKEIQSPFDPDQKIIQYELEMQGTKKYWSNGSTYVMLAFDNIDKGSFVTITRKPKLDKTGKEIVGKSIYEVEPFEGEPPKDTEAVSDDEEPSAPF